MEESQANYILKELYQIYLEQIGVNAEIQLERSE